MNYWLFQPPSGPGGGVGPLQNPNQPTGITNYILVNSIDEYEKKIVNAGGKIAVPKMEVPGPGVDVRGWMSWFEDPAGTRMALWQPNPQAEREQQQRPKK